MDSILTSVKKMLGISEEYKHFDIDIITHINSAFMVLTQLGVGPKDGFRIDDDSSSWDEFIEDPNKLQAVRTYVYQKVRLIFDPPTSSAHTTALENSIKEFEWRINVAAETKF